jgi:hypothetical protein
MTSQDWLAYFRQNREHRLPVSWHEGVHVRPALRAPLAGSLARFQLGESSDGARLRAAVWRLVERTGDKDYGAAIELFIAEEQEHGRLLGRALDLMEAPRLRGHWSDWLFRRCRHLLGYDEEIVVLLMAETVTLKYYGIIRTCGGDLVLEAVCSQILYDEKFHVRFHCEYLHRALGRREIEREAAWWVLTGLFAGASAVVAWDHRQAFRALGGSSREFLRDSWQNFRAARRAIFSGLPFEWDMAGGPATELLRGVWSPVIELGRFAVCRRD